VFWFTNIVLVPETYPMSLLAPVCCYDDLMKPTKWRSSGP